MSIRRLQLSPWGLFDIVLLPHFGVIKDSSTIIWSIVMTHRLGQSSSWWCHVILLPFNTGLLMACIFSHFYDIVVLFVFFPCVQLLVCIAPSLLKFLLHNMQLLRPFYIFAKVGLWLFNYSKLLQTPMLLFTYFQNVAFAFFAFSFHSSSPSFIIIFLHASYQFHENDVEAYAVASRTD